MNINKLTQSARPSLVYIIGAVVLSSYGIAPYMGISVTLPGEFWNLAMLIMGLYIPGRSMEKMKGKSE